MFLGKKFAALYRNYRQMSTVPIVVVLGATGTGKSKLAVFLARHFNGEVINADSMQVYRGLDIVTNKIPESEQMGCPHHLLGFLDPLKRFSVVDFRNRCLPLIDSLRSSGKMPILVGGTHYYIESVLWNVLMESPTDSDSLIINTSETESNMNEKTEDNSEDEELIEGFSKKSLKNPEIFFAKNSSVELHNLLKKIDPEAANDIHPNDKRKIMRSLQVFAQHKKTHTSLLAAQRATEGGSSLGGPLRHRDVALFWLKCDEEVLNERLDKRVDEMINAGLVEELISFHQQVAGRSLPYTQGIFQSIGFKELHNYLILSDEERFSERAERLLRSGVENIKRRSRQYAKKQIMWIENRFVKRQGRELPPIFPFDATNLNKWNEVGTLAEGVVKSLVGGASLLVEPIRQEAREEDVKGTKHCHVCERLFVSAKQWKEHLASNTHKKTANRKRKKEKALIAYKIDTKSVVLASPKN